MKLLKDWLNYLQKGEKRRVHIYFQPKEHKLEYLLLHTGLYKNYTKLPVSELDVIIALLLTTFIAINYKFITALYPSIPLEPSATITFIAILYLQIIPAYIFMAVNKKPQGTITIYTIITTLSVFISSTLILANEAYKKQPKITPELSETIITTILILTAINVIITLVPLLAPAKIFEYLRLDIIGPLLKTALALSVIIPVQNMISSIQHTYITFQKIYETPLLSLTFPIIATLIPIIPVLALIYPTLNPDIELLVNKIYIYKLKSKQFETNWAKNIHQEKQPTTPPSIIDLKPIEQQIKQHYPNYRVIFSINPLPQIETTSPEIISSFKKSERHRTIKVILSEQAILNLYKKHHKTSPIERQLKQEIKWYLKYRKSYIKTSIISISPLILIILLPYFFQNNPTQANILIISLLAYTAALMYTFIRKTTRRKKRKKIKTQKHQLNSALTQIFLASIDLGLLPALAYTFIKILPSPANNFINQLITTETIFATTYIMVFIYLLYVNTILSYK